MKKSLYSIISMCIILLVIICLGKYYYQDNEVLKDKHISKENELTQVSMMYETEYQSGIYQETSDSLFPSEGYTFNSVLSKCENGSKLEYDDVMGKVMMRTNISDKCYLYFDKDPETLANYITSLYTMDGANGLYLHDADLTDGAGDNSLRYAGANPNNYVCFGSDATICPSDNLYRIIGVFDGQVKLIKNTSIGGNAWDADQYDTSTIAMLNSHDLKLSNSKIAIIIPSLEGDITFPDWPTADLQYYLNNDYVNLFEETWKTKIATTTWSVGGMSASLNTVKQYYDGEMTYTTTYLAKIGLMYVSEYGFAASPNYWTTSLWNYSDGAYNENWMFMSDYAWTISWVDNEDNTVYESVYYVQNSGSLNYTVETQIYEVYPSFNLESSVIRIDGSGTIDDPFRIK